MNDQNEIPLDKIFQKMPDGVDLCHSQAIGKIILDEFEHDDFIDGLDRSIKYPDNAP